ncbi:MAG: hypothetical protein EA409_00020 [Saprospirales bacterium]|nr:MAG: hypothetical protein EA409_00020 [Saprospirales bacterium]
MKGILILLVTLLTLTFEINGQNFLFIGEYSYPSTESFTLLSNYDRAYITDLNIVFAKNGEKALIGVSSDLVPLVRISGKLIIYLDDGSVIACSDQGIQDNVNGVAISAYYLTNEDLAKMANSNINMIRYSLKWMQMGGNPLYDGNYTASNTGESKTDFTTVITDFYSD